VALRLHPAINNLRRAPGFTALVVLTLGLGIGATTAMFSVVDAVVINPLPFPNAERVAEIWTQFNEAAARRPGATSSVAAAVRSQTELFDAVEAYQFGAATLTGAGDPEQVSVAAISPGLFAIFPAAPRLGRIFVASDATSGERVILISDRVWQKRFGRDPAVLGRDLMLDGQKHTVVGVLPSRFKFPESAVEAWRPLNVNGPPMRMQLVALRKPGVTFDQVNERLQTLVTGLNRDGLLPQGQSLVAEIPIQIRMSRRGSNVFYLLLGAVSVLLVVACVNVSNLMLVRASIRHGELALRTALGAGRGALLREATTESLILAMAGGTLGLLLAWGLLQIILGIVPPQMTFLSRASAALDGRAIAFAIALAGATCLMFGVLPAWRVSLVNANDVLKDRSRTTVGWRDDWWQGLLVAGQMALVVVLLAGAGLMLRSYIKLNEVDLGFRTDGIASLSVQMPARFTGGTGRAFMRDVEQRIESVLGMPAVLASTTPVRAGGFFVSPRAEAEGLPPPAAHPSELPYARVSGDFFEVLEIPILDGRAFAPTDGETAVILNEILAKRYFGSLSPVGRRFRTGPKGDWLTVVGVAADIKSMGPMDSLGDGSEMYFAMAPGDHSAFLTLLIKAPGNERAALTQAKRLLWDLDADIPVSDEASLNERVVESIGRPRFVLRLTSAFAICAVVLAAIGVYGISAYWVSRRRRELAIRMAIGASPEKVMASVIGRGIRLSAVGAVVGLLLAVSLARVVESFLFATDPRDPVTLATVTLLLAGIAALACVVPAVKAARVDPMATLRAE
jgi:putative ABC transport system permease protein